MEDDILYLVKTDAFRKIIYDFYETQGRHTLPWRKTADPYRILVSEIMLQQTQVDRVIPKYREFLKRFPTLKSLAAADRRDVLAAWQGLGYNRRAIYLHEIAKRAMSEFKGKLPPDPKILKTCKGIGENTAASICAFAFDLPVCFIETNIRSVYLRHFFPYETGVPDAKILELIEKTVDRKRPRIWYWALMDYGSHLKRAQGNPNRLQSANYAKQSKFEGSGRQLRGKILRELLKKTYTEKEFEEAFLTYPNADKIVRDLVREGFIKKGKTVSLA